MTTTTTDDTAAIDQHLLAGVHSTIRSLQGIYPPDGWTLEEAMVVRGALYGPERDRWLL
jgi:hypothetical protein